ncbi:hypothetical protein N9W02_02755 [Flavobacteriaceae bacterium]|nr:hypothetical protein [Flavobacteriaceae bacterium]
MTKNYLFALALFFGVMSHGLAQNFIGSVSRVSGQNYDSKGGSSLLRTTSINTNLTFWNTAFPADSESKFKFNLGTEFTFPLMADLGIVAGWGWNASILGYNLPISSVSSTDFSLYGVDLYGNVGYQLEALDWLILQGLIKAGPNWVYSYSSGYNIGTTYIEEVEINDFDFFSAFNLNSIFLLNSDQTWGIKTGVDYGFSGGTSYSLGFVWAQ